MPSPNPMTAKPGLVPRSQIEVRSASTVAEALDIMAQGADEGRPWMPLAGGTDLMVWINQRRLVPARVLDLWPCEGLRGVSEIEGAVTFGALTTYRQVRDSEEANLFLKPLVEAARWCGAAQIQQRGTLGGNMAGASPAGDSLPVLSAWGASLTLASKRGAREVDLKDFYQGYRQTALEPDEIILRISVPKHHHAKVQTFHKVGTRMAQSISKVMMGLWLDIDDDHKIQDLGLSFGSVAPTVLRMTETEALLRGQTLSPALIDQVHQCVQDEVKPIDDIRSTRNYRRSVSANLVTRYLKPLLP